MERQANQLAPRIQMPADPFRAKANEYIAKYMREMNAKHTGDIMEQVITELEVAFGVSRQAAKIRLVELGFEEAIGTFTYVDGHYVKPHGFRKGAIKLNQTFTISAQDAAIQRFANPELRDLYMQVQEEMVRRANFHSGAIQEKRVYSSKYALSSIVYCPKCGDIYRRIAWDNHGKHSIVWRCVSRV